MLNNKDIKINDLLSQGSLLRINGAIAYHKDRIFCSYRTTHLFNYNAHNILTIFDTNFSPIAHKELKADNGNTAFEDVRLFSYKGLLLALYTYLPKVSQNVWKWQYTVGIGIVDINNGVIIHQKSLRKFSTQEHEKNWIPYIHNNELFIITNWDPFLRILKLSGEIKNFEFLEIPRTKTGNIPWKFGVVKGGTPLIRCSQEREEWLYGFIHSNLLYSKNNEIWKVYFYAIIRFHPCKLEYQISPDPIGFSDEEIDKEYNMKYLLGTRGLKLKVVFPMGLIEYKGGILMSYGKDDCETRTKFFPWEYILKCFH